MKKLLLSTVLLAGTSAAVAQTPAGTPVGNFTLTDINGNTHTLYDYLDAGKTVVIDVSATWCSPCWSYHNTNALEDFYQAHGPSGTDDAMVFFIEGDVSTTSADLNGTGSNTKGDWVTGATHPIIDLSSQASFENSGMSIDFFPEMYIICPNRVILASGVAGSIGTLTQLNSYVGQCASQIENGTNNGAILNYTGETVACGPTDLEIQIQNMGSADITSATIEVSDGSTTVLTYNYSGTLATYDVANINLGSVTPTGATTYTMTMTNVNGGADDNTADNAYTQQITMATNADGVVTLTLLLDDYASETSWAIKNSMGATLYSGSGYGSADNNTTITESFYLANSDCYTFELNDSYGDGLGASQWGGTDGSWDLKDENNVVLSSGSGDFGDQLLGKFNLVTTPTSVEENLVEGLNIYPNPFSNEATITFQTTEATDVVIEVTNMLGEIVKTDFVANAYGVQNIIIDGSSLENGIYLVNVKGGDKVSTTRIVLNK